MDSTYYLSLFLDEGRERVQQLAELFVALEHAPGDTELLNEVFRNIHSFKGMADTMDFADLVTLTHAMEGLLDALRRGALVLTPEISGLLLRCLDVLEERIAAIELNRDEPQDVSGLEAELLVVLAGARPLDIEVVVPAFVAPPCAPVADHNRTFRIEIALDPSCFMKSARALVITSSLEMLGPVIDITPSLEELEWENAPDGFTVVMLADVGPEAIHAMLGDLSEIACAKVEEQVAAAPVGGDAPPLEVSERRQLEQALARGRHAYWIEIGLVPHAANRAVKASMAVATLAEFGGVVRLEPALAELDLPGNETFRALFVTAEDPTTLRESLLPIKEILTVGITPMTAFEASPPREDAPSEAVRRPRRPRSMRVDTDRLDDMMDLLGALGIGHSRLARVLERQGATDRPDVREALDEVVAMGARMREALMAMRLVPLEGVFGRFPRVVRDLAQDLGKQVRFEVEGHEIALDRLLVDELGELLVHLIRNALDHGLETPAERQAAGKDGQCSLSLTARLEGTQVLIRVADDGRGIDVARLKEKAVAAGRLSAADAASLSPERAIDLAFLPGLSTTEQATRLSGRGVGLDAVKHKVDGLGGFIHIETQPGRGTCFELRFPLSRDFQARAAEPSAP
ncbi:MAG: cheA [Cyanobacteria bacterium RYN_339]|nr:cheA [Cyanobacteria bacterium RYN_339]